VTAVLRDLVKKNPVLYRHAMATRETIRHRRQARRWPHPERLNATGKHDLIRSVARDHGLRVLVETGTYEGETTYWLRNDFDRLVTIELEPRLYELANARLAPYEQIRVVHGNSPQVLPDVLADLDRPALFWLDSHGCTTKSAVGGSPAVAELELILAHPAAGHAALIDDVRLLGTPGWPSLDDLRALAESHGRHFDVADDVARVLPA
jgi:hypothetical protein